MKDILKKIFGAVLTVILIPVAVIVVLIMVICTPADYIKYKNSRYCKDTKAPYTWMSGHAHHVELYEAIKENFMPVKHYRSDVGEDYFVFEDALIICHLDPSFDEEELKWKAEIEDEYVDVTIPVSESIAECNKLLGGEVCKRAYVLVYEANYKDIPEDAPTKFDGYTVILCGGDDVLPALRTIIF